ncbi:UNKNOWN [Stylonychia lemnae]|uniref:Uncharacterized protein n=1 Tax=Stylonychia lemnae TaxID=5949 RepID=A0A078AX86_STYLE|nr:UNKNOWN [Stylonychia lemnae]|eukprot:CDW86784.1 UNKNOWN [Stylonychia lemnae]
MDLLKSPTLDRWVNKPRIDPEEYESQLLLTQRKFKNYKYSIYVLNRKALKIQHWFFKLKAFLDYTLIHEKNEIKLEMPDQVLDNHSRQSSIMSFKDRPQHKYQFSISLIDPDCENNDYNHSLMQSIESKEILYLTNKINIPQNLFQEQMSDFSLQINSLNETKQDNNNLVTSTPGFQHLSSVGSSNRILEMRELSSQQELKISPLKEKDSQYEDSRKIISQVTFQNINSTLQESATKMDNITFDGQLQFQEQNDQIISKAVDKKLFKNPFRQNNVNSNVSSHNDSFKILLQPIQVSVSLEDDAEELPQSSLPLQTQSLSSNESLRHGGSNQQRSKSPRNLQRLENLKVWAKQFDEYSDLSSGNNSSQQLLSKTQTSDNLNQCESKDSIATNKNILELNRETSSGTNDLDFFSLSGQQSLLKPCSPKKESLRYKTGPESLDSILSFKVQNIENQLTSMKCNSLIKLEQNYGRNTINFSNFKTHNQNENQGVTPTRQRRTRAERIKERSTSTSNRFQNQENQVQTPKSSKKFVSKLKSPTDLKSQKIQLQKSNYVQMGIVNLSIENEEKQDVQDQLNSTSLAESELDKYFQSVQQNMSLKIFGKDIINQLNQSKEQNQSCSLRQEETTKHQESLRIPRYQASQR